MSGVNDRLIYKNIVNLVEAKITADGWNNADRANLPVTVEDEIVPNDESIKPNAMAVALEDVRYRDVEIGSNLTDKITVVVVDVLAEGKEIGMHLAGDFSDYFKSLYNIPIYDYINYDEDTSVVAFNIDISGVFLERNRMSTGKSKQWWWVISFGIEETAPADQL